MKEIKGNLWDYFEKPNTVIFITTNGFVKNNGEAVMGRGCALEAKVRFPDLPKILGRLIRFHGNKPIALRFGLWSFPVKHNWWEKADIELIRRSTEVLNKVANNAKDWTFVLPRPGCGNGKLTWGEVKPILEVLPDNVLVISNV